MKYEWKDLPKPLSCFTVRNATMVNLNTREIIRHYSANTKIVVVQKCVTSDCTYYRTADAAHHYLNYAFEASAFGLPNEKAPLAQRKSSPHNSKSPKPLDKKQTNKKSQEAPLSKSGETVEHKGFFSRIFRRRK